MTPTKNLFQHRHWTLVALAISLCFLVAGRVSAYIASDLSTTSTATAALPGQNNVLLGSFVLPTPGTDTLRIDGATDVVSEGDALAAFASSERYVDSDISTTITTGDSIVSSADNILGTGDTVVLASGTGLLNAVPTAEAVGTPVFLDADSDTSYDSGEDIARIIVSGGAASLTSGTTVKTFPIADADSEESVMMITGATGAFDFLDPPAIIGYAMNGTTTIQSPAVLRGGSVKFTRFSSADPVCLGDADASNSPSPGDSYWWDAEGTCDSYDDESDIAINLVDDFTTMPASENLGSVGLATFFPVTMGYSDADEDGDYDCGRGQLCEAILYLGGGTDMPSGSLVNTSDPFLVLSGETDVPNSVTIVADYPTEKNATSNFITFDGATLGGDKRYAYIDTDTDSVYDAEEDIVELIVNGANDAVSTGDAARYFGSGLGFIDGGIDDDVLGPSEPIIQSADTALSAGALNGGGTDQVIVPSGAGFLRSFTNDERYFDHNSSGAYASGDDVVNDQDLSEYYNADALESLVISNAVSDHAIADGDLDKLSVYSMVGESCAGTGTDTLFAEDATAPMLGATLSGLKIFGVSDAEDEKTLCIYADIASSATIGDYIAPRIAQNGLTFSSGTGATDAAVNVGNMATGAWTYVYDDGLVATISGTSLRKSQATDYTVSFVATTALPSGGRIETIFPSGFGVSSASVACEDGSGAISGTALVTGQTVRLTTSENVLAAAEVTCVISGVTNPATTGATGAFTVRTVKNVNTSFFNPLEVSADQTVSITSGTRSSSPWIPRVVPTISLREVNELVAPGESLDITWEVGGIASGLVNIEYQYQGVWQSIATKVVTGSYFWRVPSDVRDGEILLRVALTDGLVEMAQDSQTLQVSALEGESDNDVPPETPQDGEGGDQNLVGRLIKIPQSPTVFFVERNRVLRPFFDERTFFAWGLSFANVEVVSPREASAYPLGAPMLPPAGSMLLQAHGDVRVWFIAPNNANPSRPILRWIRTEDVAQREFGAEWPRMIHRIAPGAVLLAEKGMDIY